MSDLRVVVLEKPNEFSEHPSRYLTELTRVGHRVIMCETREQLFRVLHEDEIHCVVLDNLPKSEWQRIVDSVRFSAILNRPKFFLVVQADIESINDEFPGIFYAEETGPRDELRVILGPDLRTLLARLSYVEAWLEHRPLPTLTIKHSRPRSQMVGSAPLAYRDWAMHSYCSRAEIVVDVMLPGDVSLRELAKHSSDPPRRIDFYLFDRLAQSSSWGVEFTLAELVDAIFDEDNYVFAGQVATLAPHGISHAAAHNILNRLRKTLTAGGLNGHDVIKQEGRLYFIDRKVVNIGIVHVPL